MSPSIGYDELVRMLRRAAEQIRQHHETLSKLDSAGGDGDHGTTMVRAMACLEKAIAGCAARDLRALLNDVGWAIMGVDGGAAGPLFGMLFIGMAEAAAGKETLGPNDLAAVFDAGLAAVRKQTKAQVGDKTMIDALVPAVEAMRAAADGGSICDVLRRGAEAADIGAAATKDLQARFGRARNIKEKSVGTPDPGATSVAFMFKGFFEGMNL